MCGPQGGSAWFRGAAKGRVGHGAVEKGTAHRDPSGTQEGSERWRSAASQVGVATAAGGQLPKVRSWLGCVVIPEEGWH